MFGAVSCVVMLDGCDAVSIDEGFMTPIFEHPRLRCRKFVDFWSVVAARHARELSWNVRFCRPFRQQPLPPSPPPLPPRSFRQSPQRRSWR